jgi:hypothetical protein
MPLGPCSLLFVLTDGILLSASSTGPGMLRAPLAKWRFSW